MKKEKVQTKVELDNDFIIHPETRLGPVHYTVANLERQIHFYQTVLGFRLHWREGETAGLGAGGEDLLRLTEVKGARRYQGTTGMYHFALLYPSRRELARAIARLFALRYPNYPTDHVVSKTTYLDDPEGNNIELYVRSLDDGEMVMENGRLVVRRKDGRLSDGREPLDVEALFKELTPDTKLDGSLPEGMTMGHVHLYSSSLERSMDFYQGVLGFHPGLVSSSFRMADVSPVVELPHVIAFNTWQGEGAPAPPVNSFGLRYYTIVLPDEAQLALVIERIKQAGGSPEKTPDGLLVQDPSQINIVFTVGAQTEEQEYEVTSS
jgi:catechol 2,3-dioxygenase